MKSILSTCALFLVLPWKLTGETTLIPSSTRQHEDTFKHHETTIRGDEPIIFSSKTSELPLKPNGETTHSPSSTRVHKDTSKDKKNQEEYTTKEGKKVLPTQLPPQNSKDQYVTSESVAEHLPHAMTVSTGESRSSLQRSSLPFSTELTQKKTDQITTATRDDHQTLHNFKSTSKDRDRHTQGKKTTRSGENESFTPQTDISTNFQKTPEVITNQSGVEVQTTETLTTKLSTLPQEKESTQSPILNITDSKVTLDISNEDRHDTTTYSLNTSTTTGFSTGLSPTVNTEVGTTGTTDTMDTNATYEITTKDMTSERTYSTFNRETIPTTQTDNSQTTTSKAPLDDNNKSHPGQIVASLIGSILFLMFVAFVVVLLRNHQIKKKQTENPDWAGPSPFIDADIQPNLPTINEDGPFHRQESKRISLHSFLPQRLSKRLSMLSPMDEEVPLEDTQASSTFGQSDVQPLHGKATPDQIQTHEANSPPSEVSSDSNIPETVSVPPAAENNENIQTTHQLDDEIIPSPPAETNSATPTPFEDVDLNLSLDKNTESTSLSDAIHIPSVPPLAPS
ncbi:protein EVI2B [Pangasianodon hypophthalmus]|uniref:protein EVI2B n=1 Tax=Pangasianodon hypophthalmus TaxID=310915 RepID=UPI002306F7DF|nr:protein EVI2B [Pangasianodon hypophthalmus]XP_026780750.3 protein EVI2B [Pangasianodon hypophthalmus]